MVDDLRKFGSMGHKAAGLYMICTLSKHEAESKYADALMLDHKEILLRRLVQIFFLK